MQRFPRSLQMFAAAFTLTIASSAGSSASAQTTSQQYIKYSTGFSSASAVKLNGSAALQGSTLQLTDGKQFEAGSAFYTTRISLNGFVTDFDFQLTDATADGFAFVLQDLGPDALGSSGGGVGYGTPPGGQGPAIGTPSIIVNKVSLPHVDSTAVVFDLHNNQGEGSNSIRVQGDGVTEKGSAVDLTPYGIDLHSGHPFHATLKQGGIYDGIYYAFVTAVITDLQTNTVATVYLTATGNNAYVPSGYGYVGFTAGTGSGTAVQTIKNWTYSAYPISAGLPTQPNFPTGFPNTTDLKLNGGASLSGSALQLTNGTPFAANSVFTIPQVHSDEYVTDFDFTVAAGEGDGFAFVSQREHISSVGATGGGLGYGPDKPGAAEPSIGNSIAVKFDLHNNAGEGANSTGLYLNGASPTVPSVDLSPSGINLHSGHTFHAHLTYGYAGQDVTALAVTIVDLDEYRVFEQGFNIPVYPNQLPFSSFVGFTAGTGATPSSIKILNWTYQPDVMY